MSARYLKSPFSQAKLEVRGKEEFIYLSPRPSDVVTRLLSDLSPWLHILSWPPRSPAIRYLSELYLPC